MADIDLDLLRAERLRMGTFDDNRRHHQAGLDPFRRIGFRPTSRRGHRPVSRGRAVPRSYPATRPGWSRTATRATTSRSPGLNSACALNYPKVVIGVSGGLDSTHALIVAAKAMDREGRPRSDILCLHLPGSPPVSEPRTTPYGCQRPSG